MCPWGQQCYEPRKRQHQRSDARAMGLRACVCDVPCVAKEERRCPLRDTSAMDVRVMYNVEGTVRPNVLAYPAVFISGRNRASADKKEGCQCRVLVRDYTPRLRPAAIVCMVGMLVDGMPAHSVERFPLAGAAPIEFGDFFCHANG